MECQICFEMFDSSNFTPKILIQCGHSFCRICLDRLSFKNSTITCPICREKTKPIKNNLFPTNYSLIELIDKNKENIETKNILEKYKYFDDKIYKNINDIVTRNNEPKKLTLKKIINDDFIYLEEIEPAQTYSFFSTFHKRNRRYNFNKNSLFRFIFNEYSYTLFVYRKSSPCKHQYSCLESILRSVFIFGSFTLFLKYPLKFALGLFIKNEDTNANTSFILRLIMFTCFSAVKASGCLISFYMDDLLKIK